MASATEKATAARVLRDIAHMDAAAVADILHVSESQVYRYWQAGRIAAPTPVQDAVEALLAKQALDEEGDVHAAVARQLATKTDKAATSDIAEDSKALPALAKELRGVIAEIMGASEDDKAWLADVFASVGDPEDPRT